MACGPCWHMGEPVLMERRLLNNHKAFSLKTGRPSYSPALSLLVSLVLWRETNLFCLGHYVSLLEASGKVYEAAVT